MALKTISLKPSRVLLLTLGLALQACYYDKQNALRPNPVDLCDSTLQATYTSSIQSIVQGNCLACHSASSAQGGIDLSSYEKLKATMEAGSLLPSVRRQRGFSAMPPDGPMRDCEIQKLEQWMLASYPR